ncbi:MAG: hypothetical protein BGN86_01925 [Caulobacterales bacterium 68-7]|nr:MAG: hypothetical protein BGN86_01925 [Caulobacterales bacterium 68-7]
MKYLETPVGKKPRVIITADPELDDSNSMVRYILHATDYETLGLIYTSSRYHWAGDGKGGTQDLAIGQYAGLGMCPCTKWRWGPRERFIDDIVDIYETVYPNLKVHDKRYPTPARLRAVVRFGNIEFEGDYSKDTPGSDLIKKVLLDDVQEPVYVHAWGGQSSIARALKSIEDQYKNTPQWEAVRRKVIAKTIIHASGSQDSTQDAYIRPTWPEIRYLRGGGATGSLAYNAWAGSNIEDAKQFEAPWMEAHINDQGPMGRYVRVWQDGRAAPLGDVFDYFGFYDKDEAQLRKEGFRLFTPQQPAGRFIAEGDTGTFLPLLDNGLQGWRPENRRGPGQPAPGIMGVAAAATPGAPPAPAAPRPAAARRATPNPTQQPLMNDLAGRLAWSVTPNYKDANHYPTVSIDRARVTAKAGEVVSLNAKASDPDGDAVKVEWLKFDGSGSYMPPIVMDKAEGATGSFRVPADAKPGDTIHIVAKATDNGKGVPLTWYARTIVTVQ